MTKLKIVYISSLGHSGSTLLDVILNQHHDVQSSGEVMFHDEWVNKNLRCTCKKLMNKCSFWTSILDENFKILGSVNEIGYMNNSFELFNNIKKSTGKNIIIDSSKSNDRLNILLQDRRLEIKVIHLIRNGYGVINSISKSHHRPAKSNNNQKTIPVNILIGILRWIRRNLALKRLMEKHRINDYLQIRYEDLCEKPMSEIKKLCEFIDIDFQEEMAKPKLLNCHNIGGSRWRFSDKPIQINLDEKWRAELGRGSKFLFMLFAGWLNKKYGY